MSALLFLFFCHIPPVVFANNVEKTDKHRQKGHFCLFISKNWWKLVRRKPKRKKRWKILNELIRLCTFIPLLSLPKTLPSFHYYLFIFVSSSSSFVSGWLRADYGPVTGWVPFSPKIPSFFVTCFDSKFFIYCFDPNFFK